MQLCGPRASVGPNRYNANPCATRLQQVRCNPSSRPRCVLVTAARSEVPGGYKIYRKLHTKEAMVQNPGVNVGDIQGMLAKVWKALPVAEKRKYAPPPSDVQQMPISNGPPVMSAHDNYVRLTFPVVAAMLEGQNQNPTRQDVERTLELVWRRLPEAARQQFQTNQSSYGPPLQQAPMRYGPPQQQVPMGYGPPQQQAPMGYGPSPSVDSPKDLRWRNFRRVEHQRLMSEVPELAKQDALAERTRIVAQTWKTMNERQKNHYLYV